MNDPVIFVSAGLLHPKKKGNPIAKYHSYLNYGLLGLASILFRKGYNSKVYHGKFLDPKEFSEFIIKHSSFRPTYPVFISLPSVFAIEWAKKFIEHFKYHFPSSKIVIGGRWVVLNDGDWIRKMLPDIDLVVYGTAEKRIHKLINPSKWSVVNGTDISSIKSLETFSNEYPRYEYQLMHDFKEFQPSIEVSRGCGLGCSFCLEKDLSLQKMKDPKKILNEILEIQSTFNSTSITPYFESSFFRPSTNWAKELAKQYNKGNFTFKWRSETRIDSLSYDILKFLSLGGLKILDIGLESASIRQLELMKKSSKPEIYLERASRFLKACYSLGIWAKVNILLYAGETIDTINETISWLKKHEKYIKGVSVNPLIVYGRDENTKRYIDELRKYGASPVDENFSKRGYTMMNLSESLSYNDAEKYRIEISKMFMSVNDYFDLKSFSYLPLSLTRKEFKKIYADSDLSKLPFSIKSKSS